MSEHSPQADRLLELLVGDRLGEISPEDRAELDGLLSGSDAGGALGDRVDDAVGRAILEVDSIDDGPGMPADFRARLARRGAALVADSTGPIPMPAGEGVRASGLRGLPWGWAAAAACLVFAGMTVVMSVRKIERQEARLALAKSEAESQIAENQRLLANARTELQAVNDRYTQADERRLELMQMLADATSRLDTAQLKIAQYEKPEDPAVLAANRRQLLDLNGTVRVAWQPFDVPGMPATEQPGVSGDVVWNDSLQQGFLRFEGLEVNDPSKEQYQVWVIDDRGMEQKVSGGVFNATAAGEVIVPIEPGIDVGRVQVFAITVEEPGGIWVPDLKRRVVVAPRGAEEG